MNNIEAVYSENPQQYETINAVISKIQQEKDRKLKELVDDFAECISIMSNCPKISRLYACEKRKPFKYFSDLNDAVAEFFHRYRLTLFLHGTNSEIGSQDELIFAYQDQPENEHNWTFNFLH